MRSYQLFLTVAGLAVIALSLSVKDAAARDYRREVSDYKWDLTVRALRRMAVECREHEDCRREAILLLEQAAKETPDAPR